VQQLTMQALPPSPSHPPPAAPLAPPSLSAQSDTPPVTRTDTQTHRHTLTRRKIQKCTTKCINDLAACEQPTGSSKDITPPPPHLH
jgi:hypothetical protein